MEIFNQTSFEFAPLVGRIGFPKYSLTFIVKATFDLVPGDKAVLSAEQFPPTGDEFYADDADGAGGIRYASDFAYFKPCADLLLVGTCHTPGEIPRQACQVRFGVGNVEKKLVVFGNRHWEAPLQSISEPEPFTTLELRYENSFGGAGYKNNPVGKGYVSVQAADGKTIKPLPNIEDPDQLIDSPGTHPVPMNFGPLDQMWGQRYSKVGTYGKKWLKERWPWFPMDFDWHFFNAAPFDMQVEGYLKGDEALFFENLHAHYPHYRSYLPGIRPRCFISHSEHPEKDALAEIQLNLDTLWVDMDAEKLALVWRGVSPTLSEDYEDIHHIYIDSEKLDQKAHSVSHHTDKFFSLLNKQKKALPAEDPDDDLEDEVDEEKAIAEAEAEIEKVRKEMEAAFLEAGIDTKVEPPPQSDADKALEAELLEKFGVEDADEENEKPLTRKVIEERIKNGNSLAGEDLRGLDLTGLDMHGIDLQETLLTESSLQNANLSEAQLQGANFANCDLKGANLRGAVLADADFTQADLAGSDLSAANLDHAIFEKAVLKNAVMEGVRSKRALFPGADLSGAILKKALLEGADFSQCILNKADFEQACLVEASVEGATGIRVNMEKADLTELRASEGPNFSFGNFREASGNRSTWEGANLTGADFSYSSFVEAVFSGVILEDANLTAADMPQTRFRKANLRRAKFIAMNLFRGSLEKADLMECDFSGSNLYEVEFLDARLDETKFEAANIKMTKLAKKS